jgi:hypothetical protein
VPKHQKKGGGGGDEGKGTSEIYVQQSRACEDFL